MAKLSVVFNNFARGQIDTDINGRTELSLYNSGCQIFKNFFGNFKGNAIYRGGLENIFKFQDCAFVRFRFSSTQDYILCLYNTKMKVLTCDSSGNIGFVQSGGADLEVTTPWNLAQSKELAMRGVAQTGDLMYVVHPSVAPYKITRASATSFTVATYVRTADPFTGANEYPSCCGFHDGALYYASSNNKKTTVWRSKIGDYENMTTGTGATDGFSIQIAELTEPILWIKSSQNGLIAGSSQALIPILGDSTTAAITPTNVTSKISDTEGTNSTVPIKKDNLLFYINALGRRINYFSYDILSENFQSVDANITSYDITEGKIAKLQYKQDKQNLIWSIRNSKDLVSLNFNKDENIIGWHAHESVADITDISIMNNELGEQKLFCLAKKGSDYFICRMFDSIELPQRDTFFTEGNTKKEDDDNYCFYIAERLKEMNYLDLSGIVKNYYTSTITYVGTTAVDDEGVITSSGTEFTSGDVGNRIVYKTATGAERGIFEIIEYTATNEVKVKVLLPPTANSYASWYRSFNEISGLTDYANQEISVVLDGGYKGEFTVSAGGVIALGVEATVACVGFLYEGIIKTFNLGMQFNGIDTHFTPKAISRAYLTFMQSSGVEVGTSLYRMAEAQEFTPKGFLDMPPLPQNGISPTVNYVDSYEQEKCLYIRQKKPLKCHITGVMCDVDEILSR